MRIDHPYKHLQGGQWLKGNLHTHSTRSDGIHPLQEVIHRYAKAGYGFLMMSDHDVFTSAKDYRTIDAHGLVLLPGNEITAHGVHMLHVYAEGQVQPHEDRQQVIDEVARGRGFTIVNHPNWFKEFDHCTFDKLERWQGYAGLEIYNGVIGRLHGSPYALDYWDRLLWRDRRVWGYANDDFHAAPKGDFALGWNVVYAKPTVRSVAEALRGGRFYASTGVEITSIAVKGTRIAIKTRNAARIVALRDVAQRIAIADKKEIVVDVPADAKYVRFECWGRGETFAWTQPFWVVK